MLKTTLSVDSKIRPYQLHIGVSIHNDIANFIKTDLHQKRVFMIVDPKIATHYLQPFEQTLKQEKITCHRFILPEGESAKTFDCLLEIIDFLLLHQAGRDDIILSFGGGVCGDISGFAASISKRGMLLIHIPTTLLAQIDASIGGKTGINHHFGKNLIGSFYPPIAIYTDQIFLNTLSERNFRSGYSEILKIALIKDPEFYQWLLQNQDLLLAKNENILHKAILRAIQNKIDIIERDEQESGIRALLNFGHSFGHALETVFKYSNLLFHGEAVSIGMCLIMRLCAQLEETEITEKDCIQLEAHLKKANLPTQIQDIATEINPETLIEELLLCLQNDKKNLKQKIHLILLKKIGYGYIKKNMDITILKSFLIKEVNG